MASENKDPDKRKPYSRPSIESGHIFETKALGCGLCPVPGVDSGFGPGCGILHSTY